MPTSSAEAGGAGRDRLTVEGLTAGYGDVPVVTGVDLSLAPGRVATVVGPNGAGKSTLLKGILGIARVFGGRVLLGDREVTGGPLEALARMGIGYVPQVDDVFDALRLVENLEMGGYLLGKRERAARIEATLELFPQLKEMRHRFVGTMSGGERKMIAVARVLMLDPAVLIMDEPTAALSPEASRVVLEDQVRRLADQGRAVLLVEQKAVAALQVSDWAYVMVQGRVVVSAAADEVLRDSDVGELFLGGARSGSGGAP